MLLCEIIWEHSSKGEDETGKEGGQKRLDKEAGYLRDLWNVVWVPPTSFSEKPRRPAVYLTFLICHLLRPASKVLAPVGCHTHRSNMLVKP